LYEKKAANVEGEKESAESEDRMRCVQGAEQLVECLVKSRKLKFSGGRR